MAVDALVSATDSTAAPAAPRLWSVAVWRDAALVWLSQHALIVLFAFAGARDMDSRFPISQMFFHWTTWDGGIYTGIAQNGYQYVWQTAFYPLFPGLERLLMTVTGLSAPAAGMLIAAAASLLAFGLLRALIERELGVAAARRGLLYLAFFPAAFYLLAPYAEALFLLLSVACFLALRRRRWLLAGLFAALAALTRPVGALLIAPMLAEYLTLVAARHPDWRASRWPAAFKQLAIPLTRRERDTLARLLAGVALPVLAVIGFWLALLPALGPYAPFQGESLNWFGRGLAPPWTGYLRDGAALLGGSAQAGHILLDMAFTTLFILLTVALWRRLPPAYAVYAWVTLAAVLMTPAQGWLGLASNMRFMLVVFPLFMRLGQWGARPWVNALILGLSLSLLALLTAIFTVGGWVA